MEKKKKAIALWPIFLVLFFCYGHAAAEEAQGNESFAQLSKSFAKLPDDDHNDQRVAMVRAFLQAKGVTTSLLDEWGGSFVSGIRIDILQAGGFGVILCSFDRGGATLHVLDQKDKLLFQDLELAERYSSPKVYSQQGPKPLNLLSIDLDYGGGTGIAGDYFRVYSFSDQGVTVAFDGELSGYDNATLYRDEEHNYSYTFTKDEQGQFQLERRGEIREKKCPDDMSIDQCTVLMENSKMKVTSIHELWRWDDGQRDFVLAE